MLSIIWYFWWFKNSVDLQLASLLISMVNASGCFQLIDWVQKHCLFFKLLKNFCASRQFLTKPFELGIVCIESYLVTSYFLIDIENLDCLFFFPCDSHLSIIFPENNAFHESSKQIYAYKTQHIYNYRTICKHIHTYT